ncbi:MAG: S-layer homology domain-containing protein [Oscillospiraceae bacterium]|nr:S-layer homology domain-containing protein [Oscillospiraceae bacterium]
MPPPFGIPPPLGHDYEATVTEPTCTEGGFTTHTCTRCGDCFRDGHRDPLGYDWSGTVCRRCGGTRENPFTDVPEGSFYYDPVIWAVANGVTTGATATTFNPGGECMRAQVVTFLYRAFA